MSPAPTLCLMDAAGAVTGLGHPCRTLEPGFYTGAKAEPLAGSQSPCPGFAAPALTWGDTGFHVGSLFSLRVCCEVGKKCCVSKHRVNCEQRIEGNAHIHWLNMGFSLVTLRSIFRQT